MCGNSHERHGMVERFWSISKYPGRSGDRAEILSVEVYAGKVVAGSGLSAEYSWNQYFDRPAWNEITKINYNHQSPY